jgi:hypothetical protein
MGQMFQFFPSSRFGSERLVCFWNGQLRAAFAKESVGSL